MNNTITSATLVRNLSFGTRRKLADFLDPQDSWRQVLVSIHKPTGEPRYSQLHVRRFEALVTQGRSPTIELLNDWETCNCTVGELVDILLSNTFLAPASVLLPDTVRDLHSAEPQSAKALSPPDSPTPPAPVTQQYTDTSDTGFLRFSFHELRKITGNFDDRPTSDGGSKLGQGGFGAVYKGLINEKPVAVKKLNPMEDISLEELTVQFTQEVQTLMTLKHENLVNMVGFSSDGHLPCLVYAYMSNGSLLDRLACLEGTPPLTWHQRCLISVGTARGLEYLHNNHHVHRDVKSGNILLDEKLVAKISDFGLTRASATRSSTTVMTERIVGTTAYMAPEALRGEITPKSDIFSFGVVLLEIVSGLPPVDENREPKYLMEMKEEIEEEELTLEDFVDKRMSDWDLVAVERTYTLANNCLNERRNRRPMVKEVLTELEGVIQSVSVEQPREESEAEPT